MTRMRIALLAVLLPAIAATACGDDDGGTGCEEVAVGFADLWAECGIQDRETTLEQFICDSVATPDRQEVDACLMWLGNATCGSATALSADCERVLASD